MTTNGILCPVSRHPCARRASGASTSTSTRSTPSGSKKLMRFASVEEVDAGIAAAEEAGLVPIKLNCTVTRDYNDADVVDLARLTVDDDWHVRFIELMPFGGGETAPSRSRSSCPRPRPASGSRPSWGPRAAAPQNARRTSRAITASRTPAAWSASFRP